VAARMVRKFKVHFVVYVLFLAVVKLMRMFERSSMFDWMFVDERDGWRMRWDEERYRFTSLV
jgi:hypothetical protein